MNLFKCAAVCVVVAICGCDQGQPTAPVATNNAEPAQLPEFTNSIGMKFKLIPTGMFTMGGGGVSRKVTLTQSFQMGVHEVTQAQYEQVIGVNPSQFKGANNPVETVSWEDAVEFCRKLSELPAEKTAVAFIVCPPKQSGSTRAVQATTNYSFGNNASDLFYAWYAVNSEGRTHPVGSKQPMHGVFTTCTAMLGSGVRIGLHLTRLVFDRPNGTEVGSHRVLRGGSYLLSENFLGRGSVAS